MHSLIYGPMHISQWNIPPMEKALWSQWNIATWFIASVEKAWFYERLLFEVVIVMVKDKKRQNKRNNVNKN